MIAVAYLLVAAVLWPFAANRISQHVSGGYDDIDESDVAFGTVIGLLVSAVRPLAAVAWVVYGIVASELIRDERQD